MIHHKITATMVGFILNEKATCTCEDCKSPKLIKIGKDLQRLGQELQTLSQSGHNDDKEVEKIE